MVGHYGVIDGKLWGEGAFAIFLLLQGIAENALQLLSFVFSIVL